MPLACPMKKSMRLGVTSYRIQLHQALLDVPSINKKSTTGFWSPTFVLQSCHPQGLLGFPLSLERLDEALYAEVPNQKNIIFIIIVSVKKFFTM